MIKLFGIAMSILGAIGGILMLFATYIGLTPLSPPNHVKVHVAKVMPEGWGFFTRDPREDVMRLYKIEENELTEVKMKNNALDAFWGVSRKNRRKHLEFMRWQYLVKTSYFCDMPIHLWKTVEAIPLNDQRGFDYFLLDKGEYLVVKSPIKPWIYENKNIHTNDNSSFARVVINY